MIFDEGFALMLSVIGRPDGDPRRGGMVLEGDAYHRIVDCRIETDFDARHHQTGMRMWARSETGNEYEISGRVDALIPLRNRRTDPDGNPLVTRITEAMTTFECLHDGVVKVGMGMTEYLDQVVDGVPVGPDYTTGVAEASISAFSAPGWSASLWRMARLNSGPTRRAALRARQQTTSSSVVTAPEGISE